MSARPRSLERLDTLIAALRDGRLADSESAELRGLLKAVPGACRRLSEHLVLSALLEEELRVLPPPRPTPARRIPNGFWNWRWTVGVAVAGLLVLCGWFIETLPQGGRQPRATAQGPPGPEPGERLDHGVALLTEALGARCSQEGVRIRIGASLRPGRFRLESGVARIEFYGGATAILEGESELEIQSASEASLVSGKLLANVPPHARGFTIRSRELELVDQGTEFGVTVSAEDGTRVHVLSGSVQVFEPDSRRSPSTKKAMRAGTALHIDPGGAQADLPADLAQFTSPQALRARVTANLRERSLLWRALSAELRKDPRAIAYYPFERDPANDRRLPNVTGADELLAGSIVGATWTSGRWPGKDALEFKRPGDRVRITIAGRRPSLTLLAWLRIEGFDNLYNSLVLSDAWGRPGAVHWELLTGGELELSICASHDRDFDFRTRDSRLLADDLGRWIQIASVYDAAGNTVTHYIDGVPVESLSIQRSVPLEIGPAQIGNWSPAGFQDPTPIRNFNGRIDELIIFGDALSAAEIERLYDMGRPQI